MITKEITAQKNLGGRPKKYTQEFVDNEAVELEKWMEVEDNIFIEKFCIQRGYHESRVDEFCRLSDKFSLVYSMLKMKQKVSLLEGGLINKYKYPMCALILSNNHNIIAKTEQKITGSTIDPLAFVLNAAESQSTKELVNDGNEIEVQHSAITDSTTEITESVLED